MRKARLGAMYRGPQQEVGEKFGLGYSDPGGDPRIMIDDSKKLISIVVRTFNEQNNVRPMYDQVVEVMEQVADRYDFEIVVCDNHSTDGTFQQLKEIADADSRVRVIRFAKNFGIQKSLMTGYRLALGDAAIQLDSDLQDPPKMILDFLELWEQGNKVVYGIRKRRQESWMINSIRYVFYRVIDNLSDEVLPRDVGDFCLVDRRVLDELKQIYDSRPYVRGTILTMGFSQIGIEYERSARASGESKLSWSYLVQLALDGILNHSTVPLRIASIVGIMVSSLVCIGMIGYFSARVFFAKDWPPGFATLTLLILFGLGLNALFLGIIGEYLGRIYLQVKRRPMTTIEQTLNFASHEAGSLEPEESPSTAADPG